MSEQTWNRATTPSAGQTVLVTYMAYEPLVTIGVWLPGGGGGWRVHTPTTGGAIAVDDEDLLGWMHLPTPAPHFVNEIRILYKNHRGETAWRTITPQAVGHAVTEWHPEAQWILTAIDRDRGSIRSFAMKDIQEWDFGGST